MVPVTPNSTAEQATAAAPAPNSGRPMRADAVKNRQRILDVAADVFAAEGLGIPIDTVAQRAGVGVGTVYRHFPTKEALFEAIVVSRIEQLVGAAERALASDDPGDALYQFIRAFAVEAATKKDLFEALGAAGIDIKARFSGMTDRLLEIVDDLLKRAESVGCVRTDVTGTEVIGLVVGACHAAGQGGLCTSSWERMVGIVCDGLRPKPAASS